MYSFTFHRPTTIRQAANDAAREGRLQDKVKLVKDVLPSGPPGMTLDEIAMATGMDRSAVGRLIKVMGDSVSRAGKARSPGDPLKFWRTEPVKG